MAGGSRGGGSGPVRTPGGVVELLADADRPGGWLLLIDRVRQSYVDLDDPGYLDFEYMQTFASIVDNLPPGRLRVTHIGGGALSFPAQVRPAAVADDGWLFVVADVAQLEPRVLAGMSRDRALARSARGADLYQGMVDDGAVASRADAWRRSMANIAQPPSATATISMPLKVAAEAPKTPWTTA